MESREIKNRKKKNSVDAPGVSTKPAAQLQFHP
jgi:hypothetical protein